MTKRVGLSVVVFALLFVGVAVKEGEAWLHGLEAYLCGFPPIMSPTASSLPNGRR